MLPFNIATQQNVAQQNGAGAEEAERARRGHILRVGLMLCLLLALFDTNGSRGVPTKQEGLSKAKPSAFTERLNAIMSERRNLNTPPYPKNVTGLYRGSWQKLGSITNVSRPSLPPSKLTEISIKSSFSSTLASSSTAGKILMQLKSVAIDNVLEMSFVYGVVRLSGASQKSADLLYPAQGVFIHTTGVLTMLTSPYPDQKLYLSIPTSDSTVNRTKADLSTLTNRRRRHLSAMATHSQEEISIIDLARRFTASQQHALRKLILNDDALFESSSLELLAASQGLSSSSVHRKLTDTGGSFSVPIDNGIVLILADAAGAAELRKNASSMHVFVEAIGESLPSTFKSLQSSALHSFPSVGCQIPIHFHSAPLIANVNDKDVPLLPGTSQSSGKLTPSVGGTGESFASGLNGGIANRGCSDASSAGFNISAQSYHLMVNVVERKAMHYSIITTFVCFVQMALLIVQLRYSQNQAVASKVSIVGMCAQSIIDALICIAHLLLCAAIPGIFFQHFMWVAILKLLIFCVLEMRAVVGIYHARYAQEISEQGWGGLRRRLATLHFRFYASLFVFMFLTIMLRTSPVVFVFILYSCWLPQIFYNAVAGTRRALHPLYLYGMALSRLFIPLYVFGCPSNFLSLLLVEASPFAYSPAACFVLVIWTSLQVFILAVQDVCGPRFFVPKHFLPQRYDYNRPVPRNLALSSQDGDSSSNASNGHSRDTEGGECPYECIICFQPVEPVYPKYMIAPCDHVFHRECLLRWMAVKLECPICRSPLEDADE